MNDLLSRARWHREEAARHMLLAVELERKAVLVQVLEEIDGRVTIAQAREYLGETAREVAA